MATQRYYTGDEVLEMLRYKPGPRGRWTLRRLRRDREIPYVQVNEKHFLYPARLVDEWLEKRTRHALEPAKDVGYAEPGFASLM